AVERYVAPERFKWFEEQANAMGFRHAACGPMVRSSYHADQQAHEAGV
ncbi:MAG: lipoyl synthase, partial [Burkholderiales bacterium]